MIVFFLFDFCCIKIVYIFTIVYRLKDFLDFGTAAVIRMASFRQPEPGSTTCQNLKMKHGQFLNLDVVCEVC